MNTFFGFAWYTREHGIFVAGLMIGIFAASVFHRWEKVGWSVSFAAIGAGVLATIAHFLQWWR